MKRSAAPLLLVLLLLSPPRAAEADLNSEVRNMFERLGLSGTSTPAGVYEGQSRGFVTGGSVSVRLPNETIQPVSVALPHLRSGCGGVDLFLGAISYISADELIRKMKTIGSSFASYAFLMALKTLCSPCENIMEKLEAASRSANSLNVETCKAGEALAEGIFGEGGIIRGEQSARCAFVGVRRSIFTDPAEGLSECATQAGLARTVADVNAGSDQRDKDLVKPVRNAVWEALRDIPSGSLSDERKEQIMSVTGTFVVTRNGSAYLPPLIGLEYLTSGGGPARVYDCGADSDCANPSTVAVASSFKPFAELVAERLEEAHAAVTQNRRPPDATVRFLDALPFPAWKLLSSAGAVFSTAAWLESAMASLWTGMGSSERKGTLSAADRRKMTQRMRTLREEASSMMRQESVKMEKLVYALRIIEHLDSRAPAAFDARTLEKAAGETTEGAN